MKSWRDEYDEWREDHDFTQYETRKEIDNVIDKKLEQLLDSADELILMLESEESAEDARNWLIQDIQTLEMDDVHKLYKYVRRYLISNIEGLVDPLA